MLVIPVVNLNPLTYRVSPHAAIGLHYPSNSNRQFPRLTLAFSICLHSVTHRPSPPPSRTSCPPLHRLRSAPLSTPVWALIAGKKKKQKTHTYAQRSAPKPDAPSLLTEAPPRQINRKSSTSYISCSFSSFLTLWVRLFRPYSLCTCLGTHPAQTTLTLRTSSPSCTHKKEGWRPTAPEASGNEPGESVELSLHLMAESYSSWGQYTNTDRTKRPSVSHLSEPMMLFEPTWVYVAHFQDVNVFFWEYKVLKENTWWSDVEFMVPLTLRGSSRALLLCMLLRCVQCEMGDVCRQNQSK